MTTSDTNKVALRYIEETTYGTITGNPKFKNLRFVSESFEVNNGFIRSETIRSDRQSEDIIRTDFGASGDLNFEYAPKEYDLFEDAMLQATGGAEVAQVLQATFPTITFANSGTANTITRSTGSWVTDLSAGTAAGLVGMWIESYGWANAANNQIMKISSGSTTTILNVNGFTPFVAEGPTAATASLNFRKYSVVGGPGTDAISSFAFERQYTDLSNVYDRFFGQVIDSMKWTWAVGSTIQGSISFMGSSGTHSTATMGDGSPTAADATRIQNTVDHVIGAGFMLTSSPQQNGLDVIKCEISTKTNARQRKKIGLLGVESIGLGEFEVRGSGEFMFTANHTFYQKSFDFTDSGFALIMKDGAGNTNAKVWDIPRIKIVKARRPTTGKNKDVLIQVEFEGFRDPTQGITMAIARHIV